MARNETNSLPSLEWKIHWRNIGSEREREFFYFLLNFFVFGFFHFHIFEIYAFQNYCYYSTKSGCRLSVAFSPFYCSNNIRSLELCDCRCHCCHCCRCCIGDRSAICVCMHRIPLARSIRFLITFGLVDGVSVTPMIEKRENIVIGITRSSWNFKIAPVDRRRMRFEKWQLNWARTAIGLIHLKVSFFRRHVTAPT